MGVFSSATGSVKNLIARGSRAVRNSRAGVAAELGYIRFSPFTARGRNAIRTVATNAPYQAVNRARPMADRAFAMFTKPVNYRQALITQGGFVGAGALYGGMTADEGHGFRGAFMGGIGGGMLGFGVNAARVYGTRFNEAIGMAGGYRRAMSRGGAFNFRKSMYAAKSAGSYAGAFPNASGTLASDLSSIAGMFS